MKMSWNRCIVCVLLVLPILSASQARDESRHLRSSSTLRLPSSERAAAVERAIKEAKTEAQTTTATASTTTTTTTTTSIRGLTSSDSVVPTLSPTPSDSTTGIIVNRIVPVEAPSMSLTTSSRRHLSTDSIVPTISPSASTVDSQQPAVIVIVGEPTAAPVESMTPTSKDSKAPTLIIIPPTASPTAMPTAPPTILISPTIRPTTVDSNQPFTAPPTSADSTTPVTTPSPTTPAPIAPTKRPHKHDIPGHGKCRVAGKSCSNKKKPCCDDLVCESNVCQLIVDQTLIAAPTAAPSVTSSSTYEPTFSQSSGGDDVSATMDDDDDTNNSNGPGLCTAEGGPCGEGSCCNDMVCNSITNTCTNCTPEGSLCANDQECCNNMSCSTFVIVSSTNQPPQSSELRCQVA